MDEAEIKLLFSEAFEMIEKLATTPDTPAWVKSKIASLCHERACTLLDQAAYARRKRSRNNATRNPPGKWYIEFQGMPRSGAWDTKEEALAASRLAQKYQDRRVWIFRESDREEVTLPPLADREPRPDE